MKFDVSVSRLEAGDTIDQLQCEKIIGFERASKISEFNFELMQLSDQIQTQLWKIDKRLTVVCHKGSIRVLTHVEASHYNASRFDNAIKKMRKCHRRLSAVNTNGFDRETKTNHIESIVKTSRILTAIKNTRSEVTIVPHISIIPKRKLD
jgi:hypothetical protein